jgi:oxygen-independent coproporphyrinogen-3 oxidase
MSQVSQAILAELMQRTAYLKGTKVETIYFGGGTPSLLEAAEIGGIIKAIIKHYNTDPDIEITLEANPDDLTSAKLKAFSAAGINRLSIGIQSFRDEDLKYLSRTHTPTQVVQCISDAKQVGFKNLSIDLIYGIPTLTVDGWKENLEKAISFGIPHISAYSLTVEEKTPLDVLIRKGKISPVEESPALAHYQALVNIMQMHRYEHYEVSNFCLAGQYSRHNTAYWRGKSYLGVGPSAHSFDGKSRCWNVSNLVKYIESVGSGKVESESEILSPVTQLNEYIMTSLRTMWGCDLAVVSDKFGADVAEKLLQDALRFVDKEHMVYKQGKLILTSAGLLFADGIASELFSEE